MEEEQESTAKDSVEDTVQDESATVEPETLKMKCHSFRHGILNIAKAVKSLMGHNHFDGLQNYCGQHSEMKANTMLAYRHLEDARMRIGKVLQAADDGVSILDKSEGKETSEPDLK